VFVLVTNALNEACERLKEFQQIHREKDEEIEMLAQVGESFVFYLGVLKLTLRFNRHEFRTFFVHLPMISR
jgi:hypothetical protein